MPTSSSSPSPVSTVEWMPSESIAELPVAAAPTNFITAMAALAAIAPKTATRDSATKAQAPWRGAMRLSSRCVSACARRSPSPSSPGRPSCR